MCSKHTWSCPSPMFREQESPHPPKEVECRPVSTMSHYFISGIHIVYVSIQDPLLSHMNTPLK